MAPGNAVDSGRQRQLLQQAQALAQELRALPLEQSATSRTYSKIFELVRLVKRFFETTAAIGDEQTKAMWHQRGVWLQEEVAALAAEKIHNSEQHVYWGNLGSLLFAGVDVCDRIAREKIEVEAALREKYAEVAALQEKLEQQAKLQAEHMNSILSQRLTQETLELKSKLAVTQQDLQKKSTETRDLAQHLQLLTGEKDSLRNLVDDLQQEVNELKELSDRRLEVIQQLMVKHEERHTQGESALKENIELQQHCQTLSVNLESNARVIEKLIELNSEVMDKLNATAHKNGSTHYAVPPAPPVFASSEPQGTHTVAIPPTSNGVHISIPHKPPSVPSGAPSHVQLPMPPTSTPFEPPPPTPPPAPHPPAQQDSLAAAFEAYLRGIEPAKPATAVNLAMPPPAPKSSGSGQNKPSYGKSLGFGSYFLGSQPQPNLGNGSNASSGLAAPPV